MLTTLTPAAIDRSRKIPYAAFVVMQRRAVLILAALLTAPLCGSAQPATPSLAFTVSMPQPDTHIFHVTFRCQGLKGELQDFKMPAWAPGYYRIMDFARNVSNFKAEDGEGRALPWERTAKATWRVAAGNQPVIVLSYDVYGATAFGVQNYLGNNRAYISPPGLFLHPADMLREPVTVAIQLPPQWQRIATGLNRAPGKPDSFSAANFDVLYDSPLLIGNQEAIQFEVKGIPHDVAIENVPATVDRPKMLADLKRMVEAATGLIGDIPYQRYTFLMMGTGNGGIEHLNSASISFNGNSLTTANGYRGWLSYVAHEYFHNFNVKRIRPIALGPFDYETENLTNMLWVSEGLSVYYQDLVLVRAGLETREQYLEKMQNSLGKFENASGHHYQSATDASLATWGTGSSGVGGDKNTTISYYDNGAMLGAMLDLKIRNESKGRASLDDAMRSLYRKYYLDKKRGFTDAEFRAECEKAAGADLSEVFSYASTTKEPDYAKYFAYAGLDLQATTADAPGTSLGLNTQTVDGKPLVVEVLSGSPAEAAGLRAGDQLTTVDGARASVKALADALAAKKAGDRLKIGLVRAGEPHEVEVTLSGNLKRTYTLQPMANPTALQTQILRDWMRSE